MNVHLVQDALRASAGVGDHDFESVLRLVNSQVDLRLSTLLRDSSAK